MERDANDLDITRPGTTGSSTGGSTTGSSASGGGLSGAGMNSGSTPGGLHGGAGMNSGATLADSTSMEGGLAAGTASTGSIGTPVDTSSTGGAGGIGGMGDTGSTGADGQTGGMKDTLQSQAATAKEKLGQAGGKAREVKQNVERTLADRLEQGANRLRERGSTSGTPAYATGGTASSAEAERIDALQGNVARGMEKTADWLRNGDLRSTVEEQARSNPGRTLLVALGVGYLLGKAFRR